MTGFTLDELRPLELFDGLPDGHLQWFCDHGVRLELAEGERMFELGQDADYMFVVVSGTIERFEKVGGQWLKVAVTHAGQVTGMLPYSRMTNYPGNTVAAEPSVVLRVHKSSFPGMLEVSEEIGRRLVAVMSDRVRGDVRLEQQADKMAALGRLSAGLAHELNNPAAAARRAAQSLAQRRSRLYELLLSLLKQDVDPAVVSAIDRLRTQVEHRADHRRSALDRSDQEDELVEWLEDHDIDDPWDVAPEFVDAAVTVQQLDAFASELPDDLVPIAIAWVAEWVAAGHMTQEIVSTTARISELVGSIKTYSHMDRSAEHKPTDVREGLDNTLTMLGYKIKTQEVTVERDYERDLPAIPANAGELNQVWTNLIDNALDAMPEGGVLRLTATAQDDALEVKIVDSGPGIPDDVRPHIFEPFFTTKDVGDGTGLGLDIALRIVRAHRGQIDVDSRPGHTEIRVLLPRAAGDPRGS